MFYKDTSMTIWGIQLEQPTPKDWALQLLALVCLTGIVFGIASAFGVWDSIPKDILGLCLVYAMVTNVVGIKISRGFKHLVVFNVGFLLFAGSYQLYVGVLNTF